MQNSSYAILMIVDTFISMQLYLYLSDAHTTPKLFLSRNSINIKGLLKEKKSIIHCLVLLLCMTEWSGYRALLCHLTFNIPQCAQLLVFVFWGPSPLGTHPLMPLSLTAQYRWQWHRTFLSGSQCHCWWLNTFFYICGRLWNSSYNCTCSGLLQGLCQTV